MRNLKKIVAVIMAVAMIASMMVPALAATVANETQANALKSIGLFKGVSDTDLGLANALPRIQAMTLVIRAKGQDAAALALTQAEIDEQLAKVADADKIAGWAKPYAAFALKTGITNGVGRDGKVYFDAAAQIKGQLFVTLVLRAMGYADVDYTNPWDVAVKAGLASSVSLGTKTELIRDEAVGVLFTAVKSGVCNGGKTLIETLVAAGAVDQKVAFANGFGVAPVAAKIAVSDVKTTGLKSVVISFNKEFNKDTVTTSTVKVAVAGSDATVTLVKADDNKSVIAVLSGQISQGQKVKVTVNGVKDADSNEIKDYTNEQVVYDTTMPTVTGVNVVNAKTIEVTFSEPMNIANGAQVFDDILFGTTKAVGSISMNNTYTKLTLTLNSALAAGNYDFSFGERADFASFKTPVYKTAITVVEDKTAPSVAKVTADQKNKIVVEFDENVQAAGTINVKGVDYSVTSGMVDGKKITVTLTTALVAGDAFIDVKLTYKGIKDVLGNEVDTKDGKTFMFKATNDTTAPTATATVGDNNKITVVFSEEVQGFTTSDYTLKDKDNKDVSVASVTAKGDNKEFYINLTTTGIDATNYTLKIKNTVKDWSVMENTMAETSYTLALKDCKAPSVTGNVTIIDTNKVRITFTEAMDPNTLGNKANYMYATSGAPASFKQLTEVSDSTITVASDNKSVDIKVPGLAQNDVLRVLGLKDVGGKLVTNYNTDLTVQPASAFVASDFGSVKATAQNTIEISLANGHKVSSVDPNAFKIKEGTTAPSANIYVASATVNSDNDKITLTLSTNLSKTALLNNNGVAVYIDGTVKDTFNTALSIPSTSAVAVVDAMKPVAKVETGDAAGQIKVTFDELVNVGNLANLGYDLIVKDKDGNILDVTTSTTSSAGYLTFANGTTTGVAVTASFDKIIINNLKTDDSYTITILSRNIKDAANANVVVELAATSVKAK